MTENAEKSAFVNIVNLQNDLLCAQRELYIATAANINMRCRELLCNDFGSTLVKNCGRDIAGEVVRRYFFDTTDYYITVDQMFERIVFFSYEHDVDPLAGNDSIRKMLYSAEDSRRLSETLGDIEKQGREAVQLFTEDRKKDKLDQAMKKDYRERRTADGTLVDDLTGREGGYHVRVKNGRTEQVSDLQADHIQSRESIKYNPRYLRTDRLEAMRRFYNSDENMQLLHAAANQSKGDVRICEIDGKIVGMTGKAMRDMEKAGKREGKDFFDITSRATAKQMADATVQIWEKETPSGSKIQTLKDKGYLDENGKVYPEVRKQLEEQYRRSMNAESKKILQNANYKNVALDAAEYTQKALKKIVMGQVIYYVLPPLVFETKTLVRKKGMTLEILFKDLKKAGKRIIQYTISKLDRIFGAILGNTLHKFVKSFFDIILSLLKETVKKMMRIAKQLVLSLVNCARVIANPRVSGAQKADAVTKTLSVSITAAVLELLFEFMEEQFGLPDILMEPLQLIVTILSTNLIMLVLEKVDLFDVRYGLLIANIERTFETEYQSYQEESTRLLQEKTAMIELQMGEIMDHMNQVEQSIATLDMYCDDVEPVLDELNKTYHMGIDFHQEWNDFLTTPMLSEVK